MRAKTRLLVSVGGPLAALSIYLPITPTTHRPAQVPASAVVIAAVEDIPPVWRHPTAAVPKPVTPAPAATVTVAAGDTLAGIAARLSRSWEQLAGWNHLSDPNVVVAGQVLKIPPADYIAPPIPHQAVLVALPPHPGYTPLVAQAAGVYSYTMLESLWVTVGGPSWAAPHAAQIALCESGGRPWAHNPSGATGLWQILGSVVAGNLYDPTVNAENAVAKFRDSHDTFAQWVCH